MKRLSLIVLALLLVQSASAYVFFYSDEIDRANNINYALANPYDGIDIDNAADFDKYNCISLNEVNDYARRNAFDSEDELSAKTISSKDFKRLRYADQKKIIDENPFDRWDDEKLENRGCQQCWTLRDYNQLARKRPSDKFGVVDFTDFDDLETIQKIGNSRFHFYEPDDFDTFNLQYTRIRRPFYEPYEYRYTPYPRFGYGIRYGDERYYGLPN